MIHRVASHSYLPLAPHRTAKHRTKRHQTASHRTAPHHAAPGRTTLYYTTPHPSTIHHLASHLTTVAAVTCQLVSRSFPAFLKLISGFPIVLPTVFPTVLPLAFMSRTPGDLPIPNVRARVETRPYFAEGSRSQFWDILSPAVQKRNNVVYIPACGLIRERVVIKTVDINTYHNIFAFLGYSGNIKKTTGS